MFVDINAINGRATHVSWQVNMDGCHDAQDDAGLQDTNEVGCALALVGRHEVLPGFANLQIINIPSLIDGKRFNKNGTLRQIQCSFPKSMKTTLQVCPYRTM